LPRRRLNFRAHRANCRTVNRPHRHRRR
jgi:hypothetical protein